MNLNTKEQSKTSSHIENFGKGIYEIVETIMLSFLVILVLYSTVGSIEIVWGSSMEPNFFTGERILVEKISKYFEKFERGDIVVLEPPSDESKHFIKRIIGLPGEVVKILDCKVYISQDGEKYVLQEDYLHTGVCTASSEELREGRAKRIDNDAFFVLGDNREVSVDSRSFGFVKESHIVGRVIFRFWPISRVGFIK